MQMHEQSSEHTDGLVAFRRGMARLSVVLLGCLVSVSTADAAPVSVVSTEDPAQPGSFSLNFGALGGIASANITTTDYAIDVDPVEGTAELVQYYQEVEPLILPGGFSTGNIIVEVVAGTSSGTYDEQTGVFTTSEVYAVHFDGDLSAFELNSPVLLPSTSTGVIVLEATGDSRIGLDWIGSGELVNPFDPSTLLEFSYVCAVHTSFAARPNMLVRLKVEPDLRGLNLPEYLESRLARKLDGAARALENRSERNDRAAFRMLNTFVRMVRSLAGVAIPESDALRLIGGVDDTIALMMRTGGDLIGIDRFGKTARGR